MRILFVSHNVPPHGNAGTETYTAELARALAGRGHDVAVFAAKKDILRRDGRVLVRREHDVTIHEIVNNLYHATFRGTWENARVERAFARVLAEHRPDVVHVQHLMYLSAGCLDLAKSHGARIVYTLHDYWLTCARMGQRVHSDGGLCHTVDFARCGTCLVDHPWTQPWAARAVGPFIAALHETTGLDLGDTARRARIAFARKPVGRESVAHEPVASDLVTREQSASTSARTDGAVESTGAAPANPPPTIARVTAPTSPEAAKLAREAEGRWHELRETARRNVDLFLTPSRFLRDRFMLEWGLEPERIEHLRFGFDRTRFGAPRIPSPDGRVRIGFLGSLVPLKGPHVLLEAWSRIPISVRGRGRLVLHGPARHGPEYQDRLLELARASGAELPGPLRREEIAPFLLATDLLVVPSLWFENSPLSIQEAIACRTPLAVSDLGGMSELVVPGENGLRFPPGDIERLSRLLATVIERRAGLEQLYRNPVPLPTFDEHVDQVLMRYAGGPRS